jgi:cobalamin synthase
MAEKSETRKKKFEKNKLLNILCVLGIVFFVYWFILNYIFYGSNLPDYFWYISLINWPIQIGGAILTYVDAKNISGDRDIFLDKTFDTRTWSPITWALLVLILLPFILPIYIYRRYDLFLDGLRYYYENLD